VMNRGLRWEWQQHRDIVRSDLNPCEAAKGVDLLESYGKLRNPWVLSQTKGVKITRERRVGVVWKLLTVYRRTR